jgi:dolichol-phosphate mannosyltransferase
VLSILVPTYNEAGALPTLIDRIHVALDRAGVAYEIVIIDDNSPDGTADLAAGLVGEYPIKLLRRPGKNGLASAVLDGLRLASGELIGVMDADLSHPPEVIPDMVSALELDGVDLAVGSRYVSGGAIEDWPMRRKLVSGVANTLTRYLTPIHDATSGFFVIRRTALEGIHLNSIGFKIGLEVMARANYRKYTEVPYVFTDRKQGTSKFGTREITQFLQQLILLYTAKWTAQTPRDREIVFTAPK